MSRVLSKMKNEMNFVKACLSVVSYLKNQITFEVAILGGSLLSRFANSCEMLLLLLDRSALLIA